MFVRLSLTMTFLTVSLFGQIVPFPAPTPSPTPSPTPVVKTPVIVAQYQIVDAPVNVDLSVPGVVPQVDAVPLYTVPETGLYSIVAFFGDNSPTCQTLAPPSNGGGFNAFWNSSVTTDSNRGIFFDTRSSDGATAGSKLMLLKEGAVIHVNAFLAVSPQTVSQGTVRPCVVDRPWTYSFFVTVEKL